MVAAKHLVGLPGVDVRIDQQGADYFHILLDRHEVIFANGAACESLLLGAEAIKTVGADIQGHLNLPGKTLRQAAVQANPCRLLLSAPQARMLLDMHRAKGRMFLQSGRVFDAPVSAAQNDSRMRCTGALIAADC
jgi:hypothetical protein